MSTPHISANVGEFAETVLMPGGSASRSIHC